MPGTDHAHPGGPGYHVCIQVMQGGVPVLGHAEQDREVHTRHGATQHYAAGTQAGMED